jgi:hypothetical protein
LLFCCFLFIADWLFETIKRLSFFGKAEILGILFSSSFGFSGLVFLLVAPSSLVIIFSSVASTVLILITVLPSLSTNNFLEGNKSSCLVLVLV